MFFSGSARLAEATSDLGMLAARLDEYLRDATGDWLVRADRVASEFSIPQADVEYLLERAADPGIDLLAAEDFIVCPQCEDLTPAEDVEDADANEEEIRCAACGHRLVTSDRRLVAYCLSESSVSEARKRRERPRRRVAILTALELERKAVLAHLTDVRRDNHPKGTVYHVGIFETSTAICEIATTSIGAGNAGAAAEAERVIEHFEPEAALFVGIAGGIKDVELGDVVASDLIFLYHAGKAGAEFRANPDPWRPTADLVSNARATETEGRWQRRIIADGERAPKALIAPIAAGEQVVASTRSATYELIRKQYGKAVAVEMEGGGFLRGTYGNRDVAALVVRGISDLLSNKSESDAAGWQPVAAANAAAFAFELIANIP
jgi:nucleoside phosphorylase/DNA-directed RNA polymerase subunit RPC12/RpoP